MIRVSTFRDITALWSSPDALAADIGASIAAVRKWRQRDTIPAEWWHAVCKTAIARRAGVTPQTLAHLRANGRVAS